MLPEQKLGMFGNSRRAVEDRRGFVAGGSCVKFEHGGTEIRSTGLDSTFQTSGIYVGVGVFILAYFYRRRSIVKAGAAVGGV